jgi:hypothetical protein
LLTLLIYPFDRIHPLNPPPLRKEGEEIKEGLTPLLNAPHTFFVIWWRKIERGLAPPFDKLRASPSRYALPVRETPRNKIQSLKNESGSGFQLSLE